MPARTPPLAAYAINLLVFFAAGVRFLAIPLYSDHLGASAAVVGILFTVYNLPAAILAIPGGMLADRFGRRPTLFTGLVLGGLAQVAAGLTSDLGVLFVTQVVGGVGIGLTQVVVMASLADSVPRRRLGSALGWFAICMQTGLLLGSAVGGMLLGVTGSDFRLLLMLSGIPTFGIALALAIPCVGRGTHSASSERNGLATFSAPLRSFLRSPAVWAVIVALFAGTLIWGTNQAYVAILSKRVYGLPTSTVGYLLAIQSVASIVSRFPAGRLVDRFEHPGRLVVPGIVGFAACQALLPHLHGFWMPALVLALSMPFSGIAMTALAVLFARAGEGGGQGTSMGFFSAVLYAGMATGPALFAPLMNVDFSLGFTVSAVLALVLGVITLPPLSAARRVTHGTAELSPVDAG